MKVRKCVRVPNPTIKFSTVEVSLEIDTEELGIDVNAENWDKTFHEIANELTVKIKRSLVGAQMITEDQSV